MATPTRPFTLEPTLVTGGTVKMKDIVPDNYPTNLEGSVKESPTITENSNVITETVEFYRTSTLRSTMTYYATLFNGSASSITPIEDVKTEFISYPDTTIVTRTLDPSEKVTATGDNQNQPIRFNPTDYLTTAPKVTASPSVPSRSISTTLRNTYTTLTHYITLFHGSHTILSSIEEISPTVVTETIQHGQTKYAQAAGMGEIPKPTDATIISSTSTIATAVDHSPTNIRYTQPVIDTAKQSKNLFGALVPSVSTLYTTHTYYTTLFSGTTSIIQSREETTHSLITLYVPNSQTSQQHPSDTIKMSSKPADYSEEITPTASQSLMPLLTESYYLPNDDQIADIIGVGGQIDPSISTEPLDASQLLTTSTLKDASDAVVFFTNFILPSTIHESDNTIDGAKGPLGNPLLNHGDLTLIGDRPSGQQHLPTSPIQQLLPHADMTNILQPSQPGQSQPPIQTQSPTIKPGAIIELTDLLDGANLAGNIGEAIKDIVQILAKGQKSKLATSSGENPEIDRTSVMRGMLPPKDGATVSHMDDPIYIPINRPDLNQQAPEFTSTVPVELMSPSMVLPTARIVLSSSTSGDNMVPPVAYVPPSPTVSSRIPVYSSSVPYRPNVVEILPSIDVEPSFTIVPVFESTLKHQHSPSLYNAGSSSSKSPIFTTANAPVKPIIISSNVVASSRPQDSIKYITSVESSPSTVIMTTTKV